MAAVRELEQDANYKDKVTFNVVLPEADGFQADVTKYKLETHGLVALDAEGNEKHSIPGHKFGKEEIVAAIRALLN